MSDEIRNIAGRLAVLSERIDRAVGDCPEGDEKRYRKASAELVKREFDKLAAGVRSNDDQAVAWALRSISDMMKGLIDIGSDLPDVLPDLWQELKDVADDAHRTEFGLRRG